MIKFKKPSGVEIEVSEASYKTAIALGWEEVKTTSNPKAKPKATKRGNSK